MYSFEESSLLLVNSHLFYPITNSLLFRYLQIYDPYINSLSSRYKKRKYVPVAQRTRNNIMCPIFSLFQAVKNSTVVRRLSKKRIKDFFFFFVNHCWLLISTFFFQFRHFSARIFLNFFSAYIVCFKRLNARHSTLFQCIKFTTLVTTIWCTGTQKRFYNVTITKKKTIKMIYGKRQLR